LGLCPKPHELFEKSSIKTLAEQSARCALSLPIKRLGTAKQFPMALKNAAKIRGVFCVLGNEFSWFDFVTN